MYGHLPIVEWLCDRNVNLDILDSTEMDALALARKYKHKSVVKYLAELMDKPLELSDTK